MIRHLFLACLVWAAFVISVFAQSPYNAVCTVGIPSVNHYGSGTLIAVSDDYGLVLTCAHVAKKKGLKADLVWTLDGVTSTGTVVAVHTENDLAAILCRRPHGIEAVPVRLPDRANGPFVNIGHPSYGRTIPHWQVGNYISVSSNRFIYDVKPYPGMSGGGTFDRQGYLCGVVIAYSKLTQEGISASGVALGSFVDQFELPEPPADKRTEPYSDSAPKFEAASTTDADCPGCIRHRQEPPRTEPYDDDAPKFELPKPEVSPEPEVTPEPDIILPPPDEKGPNVDLIIALAATVLGVAGAYAASRLDDDPDNDMSITDLAKDVAARIKKAGI